MTTQTPVGPFPAHADPVTLAAWLSARRAHDTAASLGADRMPVIHRLVSARVPFAARDVAALAALSPRAAANLVSQAHQSELIRRVRRIGTRRREAGPALWMGAGVAAPAGWEEDPVGARPAGGRRR